MDAMDDVPTKVALIAHFARRNVRILSCVGVGGKADPPRVHVSDLRSAGRCPRSWDRRWLPWRCASWGGEGRPATPNNLVLIFVRSAKKFEEDFDRGLATGGTGWTMPCVGGWKRG